MKISKNSTQAYMLNRALLTSIFKNNYDKIKSRTILLVLKLAKIELGKWIFCFICSYVAYRLQYCQYLMQIVVWFFAYPVTPVYLDHGKSGVNVDRETVVHFRVTLV